MAQKTSNTTENQKVNFVFGKLNYQLLIVSIIIVAIGFFLMSGETDIYSTTKIVIAPIVVIGGFILGFVAVLKKTVD
jgi:hypothetical protein